MKRIMFALFLVGVFYFNIADDLERTTKSMRELASLPSLSPTKISTEEKVPPSRKVILKELTPPVKEKVVAQKPMSSSQKLRSKKTKGKSNHKIMSVQHPSGVTANFEVLVHPKTNKILRTWNHTHFEKDYSVKIKAEGREYNPF